MSNQVDQPAISIAHARPDALRAAVFAVDTLNSFVRSESYNWHWGCKRAIYHLKRAAIQAVAASGEPMNIRRVVVRVDCHGCSGTGRFQYWEWEHQTVPCRRCDATGRAILYFVETEFACGVRWHTPDEEWASVRVPVSDQLYQTGWEPNRQGRDLTTLEVAEAFNVAEEFFVGRPPVRHTEYGYAYDFDYRLYLGQTEPRRCGLCGGGVDKNYGGHCCVRDLFQWSDFACRACDAKYSQKGVSIFDAFPFPEYLAAHPAIRTWKARHVAEHQKLVDYKAGRKALGW